MSIPKSQAKAKQLLTAVGFTPSNPRIVVGGEFEDSGGYEYTDPSGTEYGDTEEEIWTDDSLSGDEWWGVPEQPEDSLDESARQLEDQLRDWYQQREISAEQQPIDKYEEEYKKWLEAQIDHLNRKIAKTDRKYAGLIYKLEKANIPKFSNLQGAYHRNGPLKGYYALLFKPEKKDISKRRNFEKEWKAGKLSFLPRPKM
jgi:hypothetical protein